MSNPERNRDTPAPGPGRVLRVGIFQGGRNLEERIFRRASNITLGQSTKNTFVIPASVELPKSFTLFEHVDDKYALNFSDSMDGRISLGDQVVDLAQLRQGTARRIGDLWHIHLNDRARGKIIIGELTILFQFVQPPPVQPRPQLPPSVRGSLLGEIDGRLGIIMLGSFFIHFGFVLYLRTIDWPKNQDIEEIPDRFVKVLVPPKTDSVKKVEEEAKKSDKAAEKAKDDKRKQTAEKAAPKQLSNEEKARLAAERQARLEQQIAQSGVLKILGAKGPGGAMQDLLKGGDPGNDADRVFGQVGGVSVGGEGGLQAVKGGGGSGLSRGIDGLRAAGPSDGVGTGDKGEAKVRGVVRDSTPQDLDPATLDPNAVAAKIRQYRGALVACYESALKRNPALSGKITLRFTVNKVGKVSKAEIETDTMKDEDVSRCIIERASNWRFPPPAGGVDDVQFAYPFIFQAAK